MNKLKAIGAMSIITLINGSAFAQSHDAPYCGPPPTDVPEINASSASIAIGTLTVGLLIANEMKKRKTIS